MNLNDYELKKICLQLLKNLMQDIQKTDTMSNKEELINFIDKSIDFIRYRHPRNYQLNKFNVLVNILNNIVINNGVLTAEHANELNVFQDNIASSAEINADSTYRGNAVGVRLPSYYDAIQRATEAKNKEFSLVIKNFLEKAYKAPLEELKNSNKIDLMCNFLMF